MSRSATIESITERVEAVDWQRVSKDLDAEGNSVIKCVFSPDECDEVCTLYDRDELFRSKVVMERHGFGRGEYRYFRYPLPNLIQERRTEIYPRLTTIANRWHEAMGIHIRFPATHKEYLQRCHAAGQNKPTPLILKYGPDDYNCLHQDLYGKHIFPLQVAVLLSEPDKDFTGGEFVMTEQRPRMQSRPIVVPLRKGDGVVFAVHHRPVRGKRSVYRVNLRHGVSRIYSGSRSTLGIIFHDAQ
jgi:hypothetical protein